MVPTAQTRHNQETAITGGMRVSDIVTLIPEAESVLAEYGLHCFHCSANAYETLEDGCRSHGFDAEEIDELVDDLNQMIKDLPERPMTLTLTKDAALAIRGITEKEKKSGEGLAVIVDGSGGFCMEFRKNPEKDERTFQNDDVSDVRIFASTLTLKRIGGSTIDFREERFKLDLAEDTACACNAGSCGCK